MAKNDIPPPPPPFVLNAKNICGMLLREMMELNQYITQPAQMVDRAIVQQALGEMWRIAEMLPTQQGDDQGKIAGEGRRN